MCEGVDRWKDTGEKTNVFAFFTPWSGFDISFVRTRYIDLCLKLVRTNLNYCILGTSTATIFLSNDHFPYASITSDECHAWFHLYGTSRPGRNVSKATKFKNEKFLPEVGLDTHNLEICSSMLYRLN